MYILAEKISPLHLLYIAYDIFTVGVFIKYGILQNS